MWNYLTPFHVLYETSKPYKTPEVVWDMVEECRRVTMEELPIFRILPFNCDYPIPFDVLYEGVN
jgi:hypothetical protein